jgi:hypothetical protein
VIHHSNLPSSVALRCRRRPLPAGPPRHLTGGTTSRTVTHTVTPFPSSCTRQPTNVVTSEKTITLLRGARKLPSPSPRLYHDCDGHESTHSRWGGGVERRRPVVSRTG